MTYDVLLRQAEAATLAAVGSRIDLEQFGRQITMLLTEVYDFLKQGSARQGGHNVVLYKGIGFSAGAPIEVGVEVSAPFNASGNIVCSATPAGPVATTIHMGPYERLSEAHHAVRKWCADAGYRLAGPHWEVYGDWFDNPDALRTDVFYLLAAPELSGLDSRLDRP